MSLIKPLYALATLGSALPAAAVLLIATGALANSPRPSVIVLDQPVKNKAIDITYANLPRDGFVVVLGSDAHGKPMLTSQIGVAELKAGDHRNIKVMLTGATRPGEKLWVSLYDDADGKPGFNVKADRAYWTGKLPAQNAFVVK